MKAPTFKTFYFDQDSQKPIEFRQRLKGTSFSSKPHFNAKL